MNATSLTGRRPGAGWLRRLAVAASAAAITVMGVVAAPIVPNSPVVDTVPQAQAQNSSDSGNQPGVGARTYDFNGCVIRDGHQSTLELSDVNRRMLGSVCWLNFGERQRVSDIADPTKYRRPGGFFGDFDPNLAYDIPEGKSGRATGVGATKPVRHTFPIGQRYELQAYIQTNVPPTWKKENRGEYFSVLRRWRDDGNAAFGHEAFVPHAADQARPLIMMEADATRVARQPRVWLDDIKLLDKTSGKYIDTFTMVVADGERTQAAAESIALTARRGDTATAITPLTNTIKLRGRTDACLGQYGESSTFQFECKNHWLNLLGRPGMFVASTTSPTFLSARMDKDNGHHQGVAFGIVIGNAGGAVLQPDTSVETETMKVEPTEFDFSIYRDAPAAGGDGSVLERISYPEELQGFQAPYFRDNSGAALEPQDWLVFRSQAKANRETVFDRYTVSWKCTDGVVQRVFSTEGVNEEYTLLNDKREGFSQVRVHNPLMRAINCEAVWKARYEFAHLRFTKELKGDAAQSAKFAGLNYPFRYTCTHEDFVRTYGDAGRRLLSGTAVTPAGREVLVTTTPAGAQCNVVEDINQGPDAQALAAALQAVNHQIGWTVIAPQTNPVAVPPGDLTTAAQVELKPKGTESQPQVNRITGTNTVNYRRADVELKANFVGDGAAQARTRLGNKVRYELQCADSRYSAEQEAAVSVPPSASDSGASVRFTGVPVGQDCQIIAKLGLGQQGALEFVRRTLLSGQTTLSSHDAGDGELAALEFSIPNNNSGVFPVRVETEYRHLTNDLVIRTDAIGPARAVPDLANMTGTISYRCIQEGTDYRSEGTVQVTALGQESRIDDVRVGALCSIQFTPANIGNVTFNQDLSEITYSSNTGQQRITRPLLEASSPVVPVLGRLGNESGLGSGDTPVTVSAYFDYILLTPKVRFNVNADEVPAGVQSVLPTHFRVSFKCLPRKVISNGQEREITPTGTVVVPANGETALQADQAEVNDQNGLLGIPTASPCEFTNFEPMRNGEAITLPGWLQWDRSGHNAAEFSTQQDTHVFDNIFRPKNDGVSLTQTIEGVRFAPGPELTYRLACTVDGLPIVSQDFVLPAMAQLTNTQNLPDSAECVLTVPADLGTRGQGEAAFPIQRQTSVTIGTSTQAGGAAGETLGETESFDLGGGAVTFTVREGTFINISHVYNYVLQSVTIQQQVTVDPWAMSDNHIANLKGLSFRHQLVCQEPLAADGSQNRTYEVDLTDARETSVRDIPVGSSCSVVPATYTPSLGVSFEAKVSERQFRVPDAGRLVTIDNQFARIRQQLTLNHVEEFEGNIPEDIRSQIQVNDTYTASCTERAPEGVTPQVVLPDLALTRTADRTLKAEVPAGTDCTVTVSNLTPQRLEQTVSPDTDGGEAVELRSTFEPKSADWIINAGTGTDAGQTLPITQTSVTSPALTIRPPGEDGQSVINSLQIRTNYVLRKTPVRLTKIVRGNKADIAVLTNSSPVNFGFGYRCRGVGFDYSSEAVGLPTELNFDTRSPWTESQGGWTRTSEPSDIPAGAWCTVTEEDPAGLPAALILEGDRTFDLRIAEGDASQPQDVEIINNYVRRTVPVAVVVTHSGYFQDIHGAYTTSFRCEYPGQSDQPILQQASIDHTRAIELNENGDLPPGTTPEQGVATVQLPVGLDCSAELNGGATDARTVLKANQAGSRRPVSSLEFFTPGTEEPEPEAVTGRFRAARVGAEANEPQAEAPVASLKFRLDEKLGLNANGESTSQFAAAIVARSEHRRDQLSARFVKHAEGAMPGQKFRFRADCGTTDIREFEVEAGKVVQFDDIYVNRQCKVEELLADNSVAPIAEFGSGSGNGLVNRRIDYGENGAPTWRVRVAPVPAVTASTQELSGSGYWGLAAVNKLPSISLDKEVVDAASTLPSLPGSRGTAVLPSTAETVTVKYTVKNTGAFRLSGGMTIKDPSLAGLTLRAGAQTHEVEPSGLIPAGFCQSTSAGASPYGMALDPGQSWQCQVEVELPAGGGYYFNNGENAQVEATAQVRGTEVNSAEVPARKVQVTGTAPAAGVLRLPAWLDSMLPNTGSPWLISLLVLGIIAVGYGLYRYVRLRDEDEETVASAAGNE